MLKEMLKSSGMKSNANFVEYGFGQVEPNHLSAQRTAQIYAQLPADKSITQLEQGQFVKYDYAKGLVNFTGEGEWMLVYNEIKLYREGQLDCEFAMLKDNYQARVYSPLDGEKAQELYGPTRFLQGNRKVYNPESHTFEAIENDPLTTLAEQPGVDYITGVDYSVANKIYDYHEMDDINNPAIKEDVRKTLFMKLRDYEEKMMPTGTTMVPRVFKTNVGDIFTTNTINDKKDGTTFANVKVGEVLAPNATGILEVQDNKGSALPAGSMKWQIVKIYTMPDGQRGVKVMRIA